MKKQIVSLYDELKANNGIIPSAWLPYIELIKLGLKLAKMFTNDNVDEIIDEILAAIDLLEQS